MQALTDKKTAAAAIANEALFRKLVQLERRRSERSGAPFILGLINFQRLAGSRSQRWIEEIGIGVAGSIRDTDAAGWYHSRSKLGVIFTSFNGASRLAIRTAISGRLHRILEQHLDASDVGNIEVSFHHFPESGESGDFPSAGEEGAGLSEKVFGTAKRTVDILGSLSALLVLSPAFAVISTLIKMTSKGPVFYRQRRLGKSGVPFTFLKFRSMFDSSDSGIHREFTQKLIQG